MQVPSSVFQALSAILTSESPQYAARLKQKLNAALLEKGESSFDERKYGFKGFRDFLLNGTQNLIVKHEFNGSGDMAFSLVGTSNANLTPPASAVGNRHTLRNDVWNAFTNPDKNRVRFYNLENSTIRHFISGQGSQYEVEVEKTPSIYIEIPPIDSDIQISWMRDFLEKEKDNLSSKYEILNNMLKAPYSSGVNAAFTGVLGALSEKWVADRLEKVHDQIKIWAHANNIDLQKLESPPAPPSQPAPPPIVNKPATDNHDQVEIAHCELASPRDQAVHLLKVISNDDIRDVVLPILVSTLLIRNKK